jgi:hypothetical protein
MMMARERASMVTATSPLAHRRHPKGAIMDRVVQCPVCRSRMHVPEDPPPAATTCPVCGTSFKLPLRRRAASDGDDGRPDQERR